MVYNFFYGCILAFSFPADLTKEEKEMMENDKPELKDFVIKLDNELKNDLTKKFTMVFEVRRPMGYSRSSLNIYLVAKNPVITGFILQEKLSFWRDQFWVLNMACIDINEIEAMFEEIKESFRKTLSLARPFMESIEKISK